MKLLIRFKTPYLYHISFIQWNRFICGWFRSSFEKWKYKWNSKASDSFKNILTFRFSESIRGSMSGFQDFRWFIWSKNYKCKIQSQFADRSEYLNLGAYQWHTDAMYPLDSFETGNISGRLRWKGFKKCNFSNTNIFNSFNKRCLL